MKTEPDHALKVDDEHRERIHAEYTGMRASIEESPITIQEVEVVEKGVEIISRGDKQYASLDGEIIGEALKVNDPYPESVMIARIVTSDGLHYRIVSHRLPHIAQQRRGYRSRGYYHQPQRGDTPKDRWSAEVLAHKIGYKRMAVRDLKVDIRSAENLKLGMIVGRDERKYRLERQEDPHRKEIQVVDGRVKSVPKIKWLVTNGDLKFPVERPYGHEWQSTDNQKIKFVQGVSAENWGALLKSIHGLYHDEEIRTKEGVRNRLARALNIKKLKEKIREKGQCFDGEHADAVSVGVNLIFTGMINGEESFVVDSPEYGHALYIFDTYADAHEWATRTIDYQEARKRARACIFHTINWREKLTTT